MTSELKNSLIPSTSIFTLLYTIFVPNFTLTCQQKEAEEVCHQSVTLSDEHLAPVQNSVSLKLMQRKTLNFVINLPDVENISKLIPYSLKLV